MGRPWGTAASPLLLDPLWAPYRESWKLAPRTCSESGPTGCVSRATFVCEWYVCTSATAWHAARSLGSVTGSIRALCAPTDAVSTHGIFASTGWAVDACADYCDCPDCHYNHCHIVDCCVCSADRTGLHVVHRSACVESGGVCSPSRIRTCRSSISSRSDVRRS